MSMFIKPTENSEIKNTDKTCSQKNCKACQSFKNVTHGFITRDEASSKVYLTTQHPYDDVFYEIVKQTCFQSISCEQYPGQVGPMFFGDEGISYTFSFKFSLKDFHSRGFKRNYSINIISKDKVHLLNSWDFYCKNLEGIVSKLKSEAEACFVKEHAHHGTNLPGKSIPLATSSSLTTFHLKSGKPQKIQNNQTRSLCDITGNCNIFLNLHQFFVLLMKTNGGRLSENVVFKSPHSFIDLNKVEETEEGFVKLFSEPMKAEQKAPEQPEKHSTATFTHLRSLMKVLGLSSFMEVLYHVIIGTQVLVRAQDKEVIKSVIDCLKTLLPDGCKNVAYYTTDYESFGGCNFVGMPLLPLLPNGLRPCLLLDISGLHTLKKVPPVDKCRIYECLRNEIEELLLRYYMVTFEKIYLPAKIPTLLETIQKIILNECLDNSVVDLCLASLREDWFNKAKAYYAFIKGGQRSRSDVEKLLQVLGAKSEDKIVLTFWMTALFPKEHKSEPQ